MYIYIKKNNNKCDHPIYTEVIYLITIDNKKKRNKKKLFVSAIVVRLRLE